MKKLEKKYSWSEWRPFPDPGKGEYLYAPFGFGVYQLLNNRTKEYILFGSGNNLAYRMSSLFPYPLGCGTRKSTIKRDYVLNNLGDMIYRTISFFDETSMKVCEREIKQLNIHIFDT
jgi:hypothetical protein